MVDNGTGLGTALEEAVLPALELHFDYGGTLIPADDARQQRFRAPSGKTAPVRRNRGAESRARYLLEGFGAVEVSCLERYEPFPDSRADYLVQVEGDVHALCSFSAYAIPQLRSFGFRVLLDRDYPYQVVESAPWYARVDPEDEQADWFNLELGIEIDGSRVNLLPALLDLLDGSAGDLDGLLQGARRCIALPVGDSRYLPVPPERLRTLTRVLLELYSGDAAGGADSMRFSAMQAASLAHLEQAFDEEGLDWEGTHEVRRRGRSLAAQPAVAAAPAPTGLQATLRPYQEEGLSWLQHLRAHDVGGILADDMGLGKTLQTIAHIATEKEAGRMRDRPSMVIAPTSLVGNWQREIAKFAPHLHVIAYHGPRRHERGEALAGADVILTSYPLLIRDLELLGDIDYHLLILDEAQAIKNARSQAHRAVKTLEARLRLCLSGTPVENNLEELWSLFDFLMPGLLGSAERFRTVFRTPIERDGKESHMAALRERVAPYILRRMKDTVARDLPPKTEIVRPVDIAGAQRELYEGIRVAAHAQVRSAIKKKGFAASTITILDALMKLRQVCCDPRLVAVRSARAIRKSAKYELLMDMVQKQLGQGRRILIFSQFTSMLALIAEGLRELGIDHVALTGSTADRQKPIDAFQRGKVDVFLISLKAGGTGLNLVGADTVIHYDPWWNPAAQDQATDRAYRIGQTRPVFVYNLIVAGSVEERMLRLQRHKRHLADSILEPGGGQGHTLSQHDVDDLFAPLGANGEAAGEPGDADE